MRAGTYYGVGTGSTGQFLAHVGDDEIKLVDERKGVEITLASPVSLLRTLQDFADRGMI